MPEDIDIRVARKIREDTGMELTPEQVRLNRIAALDNIRAGMRDRGHDLSDLTDDELMNLIRSARLRAMEDE